VIPSPLNVVFQTMDTLSRTWRMARHRIDESKENRDGPTGRSPYLSARIVEHQAQMTPRAHQQIRSVFLHKGKGSSELPI
jgi:hypothetical protein